MDETSHVETPLSWIWWSLIAAISASASNNYKVVSLRGNHVYKPNLYILLLGDSGLGKGFGINLSKLLVQTADVTRVIAGRSSIQAIVQEAGTFRSRENGHQPFKDSRLFVVNGELSSAVISDPDFLPILTDLFDGQYNVEWTNLLKGDGAKKLIEPCITTLFGSSQAHFYEKIPQSNIDGGYIGRTLVIYEEKRHKYLDLFDLDEDITDDSLKSIVIPSYAQHLKLIASKKGTIALSRKAKEVVNPWRMKWRETQKHDKTGFLNRVPDHALKVAMCLSLARYEQDLIINEFDMVTAIEKVTGLVYANKMSTEGKGLDPLASQTTFVLKQLIGAAEFNLPRKILLSRGLGMYQTEGLDKIISTLEEMGWIRKERHVAGKNTDWIIHLQGDPLEKYLEYLKGKNND